jgi:hypothetical protein
MAGSVRHDANRRLLRARDAMDRGYAGALDIVGTSPSAYRAREQAASRAAIRAGVPGCMAMLWDRPSGTFGEDRADGRG